MCVHCILLNSFLWRDTHVFSGFLSFPCFCPSLSSFLLHPFLSSFLLSVMIPPQKCKQCSNKYSYAFFSCKINPPKGPKGTRIFSFNLSCHITSQISLQQFTPLSAMNENIYFFTSLPELKLPFFFIFVNLMGKEMMFCFKFAACEFEHFIY